MENKLEKIGQNSLMDNFGKTDDILNDMCGIWKNITIWGMESAGTTGTRGLLTKQLKRLLSRYAKMVCRILQQYTIEIIQEVGMKYCYSYEEQWQPKGIAVIFRMYQFNFDGNDDFVYKKYWNMYKNHFVEDTVFC